VTYDRLVLVSNTSRLGGSRMSAVTFRQDDEYLTPGEVARMLHVSPNTISRWRTRGWLPCLVTLGGHHRFRRDDIEEIAGRMRGRP